MLFGSGTFFNVLVNLTEKQRIEFINALCNPATADALSASEASNNFSFWSID